MPQVLIRNMVNLQSVPASALWSAAHNATATVNLQSLLFSLLPSFAPHVSLIKFTLNKNHLLSLKDVTKKRIILVTVSLSKVWKPLILLGFFMVRHFRHFICKYSIECFSNLYIQFAYFAYFVNQRVFSLLFP